MKESYLYKRLKEWAYRTYGQIDTVKKTGKLKIFKMAMVGGHGEGGWPDMAIFVKGGYTFFFELKNPDGTGECTELQLLRHAELRLLGFRVFVVEDETAGRQIIKREVEGVRRARAA